MHRRFHGLSPHTKSRNGKPRSALSRSGASTRRIAQAGRIQGDAGLRIVTQKRGRVRLREVENLIAIRIQSSVLTASSMSLDQAYKIALVSAKRENAACSQFLESSAPDKQCVVAIVKFLTCD